MLPQIITLAEQSYADNLTEQQMRDYAAWLSSESGRAIRDKSVVISTQIMLGEAPLIRAMMPGLIQKAVERACDRSQCTAQDRSTLIAAITKAMPKG